MKICDSGHDEIVYDGNKCPFCEEIERSAHLEDKISDLEDEVSDLESQLAEMKEEVTTA